MVVKSKRMCRWAGLACQQPSCCKLPWCISDPCMRDWILCAAILMWVGYQYVSASLSPVPENQYGVRSAERLFEWNFGIGKLSWTLFLLQSYNPFMEFPIWFNARTVRRCHCQWINAMMIVKSQCLRSCNQPCVPVTLIAETALV